MAKITAEGNGIYGRIRAEVTGSEKVEQIVCNDDLFAEVLSDAVRRGIGWMANGYCPPPDTMLQAYAYLVCEFGYHSVTVEGDIGEIETDGPEGAIY